MKVDLISYQHNCLYYSDNAKTQVDGGEVLLKNGQPTRILIDNAIALVNLIQALTNELKTIALLLNGLFLPLFQ